MKKLLYLFLLAGFSACDPGLVYEQNKAVEKVTWAQNKKLDFEVPVQQPENLYNLYVNIRNSGSYPYSNLFLFVNMKFPSGKVSRDTLEITLADGSGKWLGTGLGDLYSLQRLFKQNIRFPEKGNYRFEIEQAMRIDPLEGISDVGIRLEKAR